MSATAVCAATASRTLSQSCSTAAAALLALRGLELLLPPMQMPSLPPVHCRKRLEDRGACRARRRASEARGRPSRLGGGEAAAWCPQRSTLSSSKKCVFSCSTERARQAVGVGSTREEGGASPPGDGALARLGDTRPARCTSICADRQALGRLEYWGAVAGSLRARKKAAALKVSALLLLLLPLLAAAAAEALEEAEEARSGIGAAEVGRLVEEKTPASAHRASQASRSSSPP